MKKSKFDAFIKSVRTIRDIADDETAVEIVGMYPDWKEGIAYAVAEKVVYKGILYQCLQAHTSQSDWMPDVAVSLWAKVLVDPSGEIKEWEQPSSTNPYMKGDKVKHNGHTWESSIDNNVWEPGVYGWDEIE